MTTFYRPLHQLFMLCIFQLVLRSCVSVPPDSQCPEILTYDQTNNQTDRWYATISLKASDTLTGIWLDIELDRKAHLLGNYFGEAETTDNQRFIIKNLKKKFVKGSTSSIRFFVKFSEAETVPVITAIRWNGREICGGVSEAPKSVSTAPPSSGEPQIINLDVGTRANDNNEPAVKQNATALNANAFNPKLPAPSTVAPSWGVATTTENLPQPVWKIHDPSSSSPDYFNPNDYIVLDEVTGDTRYGVGGMECGRVVDKPLALTIGGEVTSRHLWPWHASLYHYRRGRVQYICGATLISSRAVVTAAHCVTKRDTSQPIDPLTLSVFLAKQNIKLFMGGEQTASVSEIIVHSNYTNNSLYADIAILKLSSEVVINELVRPVCLWDRKQEALETVLGKDGTVVGWEFNRYMKTNNNLNVVKMPVVDPQTCIRSSPPYYKKIVTDVTYCAGYKNGSGICNGDSGSGMFFNQALPGERPSWRLRGVVSIGAAQKNDYVCDVNNFVVLTDVAKFIPWIEQNL